MTEAVIIAVITGVFACAGSAIAAGASARTSANKTTAALAVLTERVELRDQETHRQIEELSERVERHNGLVERMVVQEMNTEAQWRQIDQIKKELEVLHG